MTEGREALRVWTGGYICVLHSLKAHTSWECLMVLCDSWQWAGGSTEDRSRGKVGGALGIGDFPYIYDPQHKASYREVFQA